jgi:hypothetical protein
MDFLLVPDELRHLARSCATWLEARGYTVDDADEDLSFPLAPSLSARRGSAVSIIEVVEELDEPRLSEWMLYGKSSGTELRVTICIDASCAKRDQIVVFATAKGLGVYVVEDGATRELVEPRDLSAITLVPDLRNEEQWVRAALGPAIEEYERANWQDGLRNATRGFEDLCRERLRQLVAQGVRFAPVPERKRPPALDQIDRASLGQLRIFFSMIDPSTAESSTIVRVIDEIRDPRNDIAHQNDTPEHRTHAVKLLYVILRGARELKL